MSEVIFVLVVVFVAYVGYTVLTDKNGSNTVTHQTPAASPTQPVASNASVVETPVQNTADSVAGDELKNPATGEVSKIPNNYRFGKRWIKDALVAEGLLDRVYKNNELDDAVSAKVQTAMAALKNMDKYRV